MRKRTVLSLEQALSLPYATWRFAHLGWRVIRIEATPNGAAAGLCSRNGSAERRRSSGFPRRGSLSTRAMSCGSIMTGGSQRCG